MWILDYITRNSFTDGKTEQGSVKGSAQGKVEVNASSNFCKTPISSPYGIAYIPPEGEKSVVVPSSDGEVCMGIIAPDKGLKPGEIMLYSKGGATLKLGNDGNVYINGVRYQ